MDLVQLSAPQGEQIPVSVLQRQQICLLTSEVSNSMGSTVSSRHGWKRAHAEWIYWLGIVVRLKAPEV
jgi:hypothetical protein